MQPTRRGLTVTKEIDHSADLGKAREKLLAERRELAADLTRPTKEAMARSENASWSSNP
jgi:hypothetical protein